MSDDSHENAPENPVGDSERRNGDGEKNSQPSFGIQNPPGPLKVVRLKDGRRLVARDLKYRVDAKTVITVKKGFKTDYSSDPIGLLDWSQVDVAGVVHDYLYQHPSTFTRAQEDKIWLKIARHGDWRVGPVRAYLGYWGIRLFGRLYRKGDSRTLTIGFALVLAVASTLALWKTCFYRCSTIETAFCVLLVLVGLKLIDHIFRSRRRKNIRPDEGSCCCCTHCQTPDESANTTGKDVLPQTDPAA